MNHFKCLLASALVLLAACAPSTPLAAPVVSASPAETLTPTGTPTNTATPTLTSTLTPTSTPTNRPTGTPTIMSSTPPPDTASTGVSAIDVVSQDTAGEQRAPYGDSYRINLFERPFSQDMATYFPDLDISTFALGQDENWFFFTIRTVGPMEANSSQVYYGVELDLDRDGFGDYLIWAHPARSPRWTTKNVEVLADKNHDSAGLTAERSDALFNGDGYETPIFDGNKSSNSDPGLAWVRADAAGPNTIQFAIKRLFLGKAFMWGVWADGGLREPKMFSYNDHFTQEEAGSPVRGSPYYPIKALYLLDSTCRMPYGFKPTGDEPLLCPPITPDTTPAPRSPKKPTPTNPPFAISRTPPGTP